MNRLKLFVGVLLAWSLLLTQLGGAAAAPSSSSSIPVSGIVQSITLETDSTTGVTVVILDLVDNDLASHSVQVSLETGIALGLVLLNGDGKPGINTIALGKPVEIEPSQVMIATGEDQHPVGSALATYFSDIAGIDYETIMSAHEQGAGFGLIAQALWLTTKLEGDAETFAALITAKQTGDYSDFVLDDGSIPENWGQLRKAVLDKGKHGLGVAVSGQADHENGNGNNEDRGNQGHGNQGNRGQNKVKDREKDKKR